LEAISTRYPDGSDWLNAAFYMNAKRIILPNLNLHIGNRLTYIAANSLFDDTFFTFPFEEASVNDFAYNGALGFSYRPKSNIQLNANYSSAFRAPNIDDLGKIFDSEPGSVIVPNPNLSAEFAHNIELDFAISFFDKIKFDIVGYYTLLNNALVRRNFQFAGSDSIIYDGELSQVQAIQNAANAYVYGFQGNVEWRLPFNFSFSGHLNWQRGFEELDDGSESPLRHIAPLFGDAMLSYRRGKIIASIISQFNGELSNGQLAQSEFSKNYQYARNSNGEIYQPSWAILNFNLLYRASKNLAFTAAIENITDQRYRPYSSGISAPGINFIGAVKVNI